MNFNTEISPWNMPELSWRWGYPAALLLMFAVVVAQLAFFRRKGWLGPPKATTLLSKEEEKGKNRAEGRKREA